MQISEGANSALYRQVTAAGIPVTHACEVGVYMPDTSNVLGWINGAVRTTLVECDPAIVAVLHDRFAQHAHVRIEGVAVADAPGTLTLYRTGASTFGANVPVAPALANDGYTRSSADAFTVPAVTFDTIDDGSVDVLSIDVEGGEWFVLRHLRSRPQVICVETHGKRYVNPFLTEIDEWMRSQGYGAWYRDACDTVYRKGWTTAPMDLAPAPSWWQRVKRAVRGY